MTTAYPFLMFLYHMLGKNDLNEQTFIEVLKTIENYLVRRYLVGEPTNFLNKMFPALLPQIDWTDTATLLPSLRNALKSKNYPDDRRLFQSLQIKSLYEDRSKAKTVFVLEAVNQELHRGTGGLSVLNSNPTVEHIMPQTLSQEWKSDLGADWLQIQRNYLHTLGNLTLVTMGWNAELSNAAYSLKKQKLSQNALLLNSSYFGTNIPVWNDTTISNRTNWLARHIVKVWPEMS